MKLKSPITKKRTKQPSEKPTWMLSFTPAPSLLRCRGQPEVAPGRLEDKQGDTSGRGRKSVLGTGSREGLASQERKVKASWAVVQEAEGWTCSFTPPPETGEITRVPRVAAGGGGVFPIQSSLGGGAEGEQRGGGVGVQPQGPGDLRSHGGLLPYPPLFPMTCLSLLFG